MPGFAKLVEAGIFELFAFAGLNPAPVQVLYNLPQGFPLGVPLENFQHHGGGCRVNL